MRGSLVVTSITTFYLAQSAFGQTGTSAKDQALDLFLLLDNSGSMQQNDPHFLMRAAAQAFAESLPSSSRVGVVIFDDAGRIVLNLTDRADPGFNSRIATSLATLDYRGQYTDIPGGFQKALYDLRERGRPNAQKIIVLVTDGVVDLRDKAQIAGRKQWLQEDQLREAIELKIRVFGIAFTNTADLQLVQSLSTATKGTYKNPGQAADLASAFDGLHAAIIAGNPVAESKPVREPPKDQPPREGKTGGGGFNPWAVLAAAAGLVAVGALIYSLLRVQGNKARSGTIQDSERASLQDLVDPAVVFLIDHTPVRIGRESQCDVALKDDSISQPHAVIEFRGGSYYLRDLRSANGTWLDMSRKPNPAGLHDNLAKARRVNPSSEEPLKHGDIIRFGRIKSFLFETVGGGGTVVQEPTRVLPASCSLHPDREPMVLCRQCQIPLCQECAGSHRCHG